MNRAPSLRNRAAIPIPAILIIQKWRAAGAHREQVVDEALRALLACGEARHRGQHQAQMMAQRKRVQFFAS